MASKKIGKERLDRYYKLAKEHGYRSRSAFKLVQLNKKYDFLKKTKTVVDLCAAPGGWLQVAKETLSEESTLIGIDLVQIKNIPGVHLLEEDITAEECRNGIQNILLDSKADVFLHDGAPNVGSSWLQDAYNQNELVLHSLKLASSFLKKDGLFITKVFRSKDYNNLLWVFKKLFRKVEATKPPASRDVSAETFVVCLGFLGPDTIDPKFFDPEHVFKEVAVVAKKKTDKVNRGGYEDDNVFIYKQCTADEFVLGRERALEGYNRIQFPPETRSEILTSKHTTDEIRELCSDIQIIGKDLRRVKRWRERLRKELKITPEENEEAGEKGGESKTEHSIEDEIIRLERQSQRKREKRVEKTAKKLYGMNPDRIDSSPYAENTLEDPDSDDEEVASLEEELRRDTETRKQKTPLDYYTPKKDEELSALLKEAEEINAENIFGDRDDESSDERELDDEELAVGVKLMTQRGKKELVDSTVGKRHNREESVPDFIEEELAGERRKIDLTKEEREIVEEKKTKINKKSVKKEMEAIQRKKKRQKRKIETIKGKMCHILDGDENNAEKTEKMVKLDKELKSKNRRKKNFVFVSKGGAKNSMKHKNGKTVYVDSRMKKDIRKERRRKFKK
ncbi:MAG: rRNA methyltransferase Spb1 [Amphiamblys sp. WSBS2006]|nr:MAG: rRNA methyltransferase Spb1 [Amphiamblys sp. WSBS2006]